MPFKFEPNLEHMAKQALAVSLWERKDVTDKIKITFENGNGKEEWDSLIKAVSNLLDEKLLSPMIHGEFVYIVRDIGRKIFGWLCHVWSNMGKMTREESYNYFGKKIFWTRYGTIDEVKILRSSWFNAEGIDNNKALEVACNLCLEEEINKFWQKVPKRSREEYEVLGCWYEDHLKNYWGFKLTNGLEQLIPLIREEDHVFDKANLYNEKKSVNYNMFRLCVRQENRAGTEYFFKKLKAKERKLALMKGLDTVIWHYAFEDESLPKNYFRQDNMTGLSQFLLNQISDTSKEIFFKQPEKGDYKKYKVKKRAVILEIFTTCLWPWQECLLPALEEILEYLTKEEYTLFLKKIVKTMKKDKKLGYHIKNSICFNKLKAVLAVIPDNFQNQ